MNADVLKGFNLSTEIVEKSEGQKISTGKKILPSGPYKAEVREVAQWKHTTGTTMLKVVLHLEKEDMLIEEYYPMESAKGDEYVFNKERLVYLTEALDAATLSVKAEKVMAYKKEVEATVLKGTIGHPIIALVYQTFEEGGDYPDNNEVDGYLKPDGTNKKGEDLLATFKEKVEKTPVRKKKTKAKAGAASASTAGTVTAEGKAVADML